MNHSETAILLAKICAYDRRTVGRADVQAWTESLDEHMSLQDAMEAVTRHFRESTDWLMPVHVIRKVAEIRKGRLQNAPVMLIPKDLHQAVERQWTRAFTDAVKDGADDPHAVADEAMGITRPQELETPRDLSVLQMRPKEAIA